MRLFYKILPIVVTAITSATVFAQESKQSAPISIITNDSEATSFLGGGWPPQNMGKKVGKSKADSIFNGTNAPKITDTPGKKVNQKLLAQVKSAQDENAPIKLPDPYLRDTTKKPSGIELKLPPKESPKENQTPKTELPLPPPLDIPDPVIPEPSLPTPSLLPPLPSPVDLVQPAVPRNRPERPRSLRNGTRSLYTLGAGDSVTFATFERSDLNRTVRIGPDGTVSYLQAVAVKAGGLTIDQLREKMQDELRKYRRDFKLIVTPEVLQSKEFAILGRVRTPGTFTLDRPTTILEGIALAKGIESGTVRGSAFGLADFERSFVSRGGKKLKVDLCKLYHEGDLAQNVYLRPNDYLYVASVLKNQFYALGAVNSPGRIGITNKLTTASAIALAGGFRNDAYRMKVVVIRGDINNPNVQIVNVRDVLRGQALDIQIKNRDIVFVNDRPFEILERVLDSAITTYVQTVTTEAFNQYYNPLSD